MKHPFLSLAVALVVLCTIATAQESMSTTRFQKQHKQTHFMKENLKQSEASILLSLNGQIVGSQQTAIQTARDLEQLFPDYPFSSLIEPLGRILKSETSDSIARRLAALALNELHSDAADAVVKGVADRCDDKGLQTLCQALSLGEKVNNSIGK
jgi:hypothetical protein